MSRTDRVVTALIEEIERHRAELDNGAPYTAITLHVRLNWRTGQPDRVIYTAKNESAVHY